MKIKEKMIYAIMPIVFLAITSGCSGAYPSGRNSTGIAPEPAPIVKAEPIPTPKALISYYKARRMYMIATIEVDNVRLSSLVIGRRTAIPPSIMYVMMHVCMLADVPWYTDTLSKDLTLDRVLVIDNLDTPYIGRRLATDRSDCSQHIERREAMGVYVSREYLLARKGGFDIRVERTGAKFNIPAHLVQSLLNGLDSAVLAAVQASYSSSQSL